MKAKHVNKILKNIADRLPVQRYAYPQTYTVLGCDIEQSGLKIPEGMEIEDDKEYHFKDAAYKDVNHLRRIRKAYKKGGKKEVFKYIVPFVEESKRFDALKFIHSLPI